MRHRDWTTRLGREINESLKRPFAWGEFDCCLFAANCCIAVCGVDPAEKYRGQYDSETGAKRALLSVHGGLEEAWDSYFENVQPELAQRGDVAMYDDDGGRAVAVMWAGSWWCTSDDGVIRVDCDPISVWRVEA